MNTFWENKESALLMNPCYLKSEQDKFSRILEAGRHYPEHVWLTTSGSTVQKWVGLSKSALLISAAAINRHLESNHDDRWINALPYFHVGGLGISARAYLSRAKIFDFKQEHSGKWNVEAFYEYIKKVKGTLSSLVPAQLYDLVLLKKKAPVSLRALIIGGGALNQSLYEQAVALGWPILPSYGLTECSSQVATARLESWNDLKSPSLQLLSHMQAENQNDRLCFSGPSLLSTYAYLENEIIHFVDPKVDGWFISEDRGRVENQILNITGRRDAIIKVGGENVDLEKLESVLQAIRLEMEIESQVTLVAVQDKRLGHSIHLACSQKMEDSQMKDSQIEGRMITALIDRYDRCVLPFERIRKTHVLDIPLSPMGKILRNELKKMIECPLI